MFSRGLAIVKTGKLLNNNNNNLYNTVRNSSHAVWNYRTACPKPTKFSIYTAEFIQGVAWWWILWHLWTQHDHITGEFEYPDATKWTDEELGIPPE